ncbi:MAG: AIR synthase-related protein, partial [Candidatus Syntropharchaeales archaeon]
GLVPETDPTHLRSLMDQILNGIASGAIVSCHDLSEGGLGVSLSEMVIGSMIGARIDIGVMGSMRPDYLLFSESNSRWVLEVERKYLDKFISETEAKVIGEVGGSKLVITSDGKDILELSNEDIARAWSRSLI